MQMVVPAAHAVAAALPAADLGMLGRRAGGAFAGAQVELRAAT